MDRFSFSKWVAGSYKNGQLIENTDCKPWVEDNYWEIKRSNNAIIEEAYKQFNGKFFVSSKKVTHVNFLVIDCAKFERYICIFSLFYRCSPWMQTPQQQSHSCHFTNWKIHELEEAAKAIRHLSRAMKDTFICNIHQNFVEWCTMAETL